MDLFITAAKEKFRFDSKKGQLTVEDLFDLALQHSSGTDLDNVAQSIAAELESVTQKSFVNIRPNPKKALLEKKLEVVKIIIQIKQDEADATRKRLAKNAERTKILNALEEAERHQLAQSSVEELEKRLAALDA